MVLHTENPLKFEKKETSLSLQPAVESIMRKYDAAEVLEFTDQEIQAGIDAALDFLDEGGHMYSYRVGGDYLTEAGEARNRIAVRLDIPELLDDYPFLKYLIAKVVPMETDIKREVSMHQEIQNKVHENKRAIVFDVPELVSVQVRSHDMVIVMERLPSGPHDMSLQRLIAKAKSDKIAIGLADEVRSRIDLAYNAIHRWGLRHGDVNEGNIYLKNIQYRDVVVPQEARKQRPKKVRMIFDADVVLLDFEQAEFLPVSKVNKEVAVASEDREVQKLLDERFIDIMPDSSAEEIAEAVDEWRRVA